MAVRVAVVNNKGGSGKTALTINLAAALAETGRRVLVVDLDPQANASRRLGRPFRPDDPTPTISEALRDGSAGVAADAIVPCAWPDSYGDLVHVLPSRFDLENRIAEAGTVGAGLRLRRILTGADDAYDLTLIDCPPSLGHLPQMAFTASTAVLCVLEPEFDGVEGAVRVGDFLEEEGEALGVPGLAPCGYVVNRVRSQLGAHAYQIEGLPELFGDRLWDPQIPERSIIKDAGDAALPLRALGGTSAKGVADLYAAHAAHLLRAVNA